MAANKFTRLKRLRLRLEIDQPTVDKPARTGSDAKGADASRPAAAVGARRVRPADWRTRLRWKSA